MDLHILHGQKTDKNHHGSNCLFFGCHVLLVLNTAIINHLELFLLFVVAERLLRIHNYEARVDRRYVTGRELKSNERTNVTLQVLRFTGEHCAAIWARHTSQNVQHLVSQNPASERNHALHFLCIPNIPRAPQWLNNYVHRVNFYKRKMRDKKQTKIAMAQIVRFSASNR